jgi:large subunit ribosomal protein L21e
MVDRKGSARRKTRKKFSKENCDKGKISIAAYFQSFKEGDKVVLKAEPAYQKGLYWPRHHGRAGTIIGKQGNCYKVEINDRNKKKMIIIPAIHLKRT